MNKLRIVQIQFAAALVVVALLVITLVATVVAGPVGVRAAAPATAQAAASHATTVSLSHALGEEAPMVIVFMPVEQCSIQYCVTADLIAKRLGDQEINVVSAPVHAVPMGSNASKLNYPMIDWGVYIVEPFAHWLPEFTAGPFGYGLDATAAVLIDENGEVVMRHQQLVDVDGFVEDAIVYSTTNLMASQ